MGLGQVRGPSGVERRISKLPQSDLYRQALRGLSQWIPIAIERDEKSRTSGVPPGLARFSSSTQRLRAGLTYSAPSELDAGGWPGTCDEASRRAGCSILNLAFFAKFRVGIFAEASAWAYL